MGQHQNTKQKSTQTTNTNLQEVLTNELNPYYANQFNKAYGKASNALNTLQKTPTGVQYKDNFFSSTPNAIVQNMVSSGVSNIKAGADAAQRDLLSALSVQGSGDNSALGGILARQSQIANAGAANALVPAALEQQRAYDVQDQGLLSQQNQMKLAERGQLLSEQAQNMNLLNMLLQAAEASKTSTSKKTGTETIKTKGSSNTSMGYF